MRSPLRQSVVVTGASSGMGRASAREFARHGAVIVLAARREQTLNEALAECEDLGGDCTAGCKTLTRGVRRKRRQDDRGLANTCPGHRQTARRPAGGNGAICVFGMVYEERVAGQPRYRRPILRTQNIVLDT